MQWMNFEDELEVNIEICLVNRNSRGCRSRGGAEAQQVLTSCARRPATTSSSKSGTRVFILDKTHSLD